MAPRPTLGIYAPLPGTPSGIADYAQLTATRLAERFDVAIVSLENYTSPHGFDHVLYHIGNGRHSAAAYRAASTRRGPVILHEYVLSQFFIENHDLLDEATNAHVRHAFGKAFRRRFSDSAELDSLMRRERDLELHYLDVGLERLVIERATVAYVHSPTSVAVLRSRYGDRVRQLDFPKEPLPTNNRKPIRAALGIPDGAKVFGSFGFVGTNKRLSSLIQAWEALDLTPELGHLLIVGADASRLSVDARTVTVFGYVPRAEDFADLLGVVDVGIQLRWPTLGETSGVAARLLASNIPVIVSTDSIVPEWRRRDLVQIVEPDQAEVCQLANTIATHVAFDSVRGSTSC